MIKKRLTSALLSMLFTAYAAVLIVFSEQLTADMRTALDRCINVIIPSLFAFMAISDLIIRSGAYIYISKLFAPLAYLIRLPVPLVFTFLLGNTAGYPVGASLICTLCDQGRLSKKSAERLLCTCFNGGPAFFAGTVGIAVFSSVRTGLIVFFSIILANVIAAAVLNRIFPIEYTNDSKTVEFRTEMLSDSVYAAGVGLYKICLMILFFQTFITVLNGLGLFRTVSGSFGVLAASLLEISNLSSFEGLPFRLLPLIAASGAFGGLCVIMQIKTIVGKRFSVLPFCFARIFCAALSACCCIVLNRIFGVRAVETAAQTEFIVNFNNFIPSICLIMMIFLTVFKKRLAFSSKM